MYEDLPQYLQERVRHYLLTDNFPAAKAIHDNWIANQHWMLSLASPLANSDNEPLY